jgi:hypothetical protein
MKLTGEPSAAVWAEAVDLRDLTILRAYGIEGEGTLKADLKAGGGSGKLSFTVNDAKLKNTTLGGTPLPLSLFHTIRGVMTFSRGNTEIPSVTLEGAGVYARISGSMEGRLLRLLVEVMHDATYTPDPMVVALLRPYRVSPGYYVIPVKQATP